MLSAGPMSRADAAASYLASQPRHGSHRGIGEVAQQRRQPARPGDAVGIDEGDQRRAHGGEAGVPGGAGSSAPVAAQAEGTGRGGGRGHGGRVNRPVVDHDDPHAAQAGQAPGQFGRAVAHRDDGGYLVRPWPAGRVRVGEPGVEQAPGQFLRGGPAGHRHPVPPPAGQRRAARAKAQQAQRRPAHQDGPAGQAEQARVGAQAHPGRHGGAAGPGDGVISGRERMPAAGCGTGRHGMEA
jgi:hypothetical protein